VFIFCKYMYMTYFVKVVRYSSVGQYSFYLSTNQFIYTTTSIKNHKVCNYASTAEAVVKLYNGTFAVTLSLLAFFKCLV